MPYEFPLADGSVYGRLPGDTPMQEMERGYEPPGHILVALDQPLSGVIVYRDLETVPVLKDHHCSAAPVVSCLAIRLGGGKCLDSQPNGVLVLDAFHPTIQRIIA
jgi:hypothetical protein